MSGRRLLAGVAVLGATTIAGCGHASSSSPPIEATAAQGRAEAPATCGALASLVDLRRAMSSSPTSSSSPLYALVDAEEELGYARAADRQLGASSPVTPVRESVHGLVGLLEARTARLRRSTENARDSYAAAEAGLATASTCRGIDLRELAKHAENTQDAAIARSKACAGPLRLWAATKGTQLASETSTSGVAAQIGELRLDKENALQRDRLASALGAHARRLFELRSIGSPTKPSGEDGAFLELRGKLSEQVESAYRECLAVAPASARPAKSTVVDPRSATVLVRPTWSGALKTLGAGQRSFGSGFLVRWQRSDGRTETLIVTNRHVMEGAIEAEILFASEIDGRDHREKSVARSARLVAADEADDVAVLRVEGAVERSEQGAPLGLTFRPEPPREQEAVVAAGFPGVGMMPSFQVTTGVVSNAHFGSDERDVGIAYVQHTAPIDPGNSGGPLFDQHGRLVGMNTAKLHGRENVSLAIPASRIRFALRRAEERRILDVSHAEVSCNVVLDALAAERPSMPLIGRFGLALFESAASSSDERGSRLVHRDRIDGEPDGPIDDARVRAYEATRDEVEQNGGVRPFEACTNVEPAGSSPSGHVSFRGRFHTRTGVVYGVTLAEENEVVRLVALKRQPQL
jgi:S1-C subfamily serine protease